MSFNMWPLAKPEVEYEACLVAAAAKNFHVMSHVNVDKRHVVEMLDLEPHHAEREHQLHILLLDRLPQFFPTFQQFHCDHMDYECVKYNFGEGQIIRRPHSSGSSFRASGRIYVCMACGQGHHCDKRTCQFTETCPWSGIVRGNVMMSTYARVFTDDLGRPFNQIYEDPPCTGDGVDARFQRILNHYATRRQVKFPKILSQLERDSVHNKVRQVVMDLLCYKSQQPVSMPKYTRKGKEIKAKRPRLRSPQRSPIEIYLRSCTVKAHRPMLLNCIEEELRSPCNVQGLDTQFKLEVVNFIAHIITLILRTGLIPHFDVTKATLGILYTMNNDAPIMVGDIAIVKPHARIAKHIIPCNEIDARFRPRYDKSQIIPGKTIFTNALRKLTSGNYNYSCADFAVKALPP